MSTDFLRYIFPFGFQMRERSCQFNGGREDMEDGSVCYCWTFAATLSFALWFHHSTAAECEIGCSIAHVERRQAADAGEAEFQSASPCEQRAASRLWPLMSPGRAITSCAHWQQKRYYISHNAICLFASDTCCSCGGKPMIKPRAVTLKDKATDSPDHKVSAAFHISWEYSSKTWKLFLFAVVLKNEKYNSTSAFRHRKASTNVFPPFMCFYKCNKWINISK